MLLRESALRDFGVLLFSVLSFHSASEADELGAVLSGAAVIKRSLAKVDQAEVTGAGDDNVAGHNVAVLDTRGVDGLQRSVESCPAGCQRVGLESGEGVY